MVQHPAGSDSSSPRLLFEEIHEEAVIAFTHFRAPGIRNAMIFEAVARGSQARVPTLRRSGYPHHHKAR